MSNFPFVGGSFSGRSPAFDCQRTINLYFEPNESGSARSPGMLIGTPGLSVWSALAGNGVRALLKFSETVAIAVVGATVYRLTTAGVATAFPGTVDAANPVVSMASNGTIIMLVCGATGYFLDPNALTLTQITDPDFAGADTVYYDDGYFIFNKTGTGQFQITQLYGSNIDGLDFATAEGAPDNIISIIVDHREVWLFGTTTTEVWFDNGDSDFPFARIQGAFLEVGCAAAFSVAKADNTVFWLATDDRGYGTIQRASGYTPTRVSNHAVEYAIASYSTISDAVAYTYAQEGHTFYVITFPSANATWVLDIATNLWHERGYLNADGTLGRHRSNCQMNFAGKTLVGDWQNGNIYTMSLEVFSDNGNPIKRTRIAPHVTNSDRLQFFHSLQIDLQAGVGLNSGQGSDPQAMLSWSDDGGVSWSNEHWSSFGKIGNRTARAKWRRLGRSRDRAFRVSITDPVRVAIASAQLEVTGARS
jgi:hypothetical protein